LDTLPGNVAVVGAGVFGASSALELRSRGHAVTLVDPGPLPHEAAASTDVSKMIRMDYGSDVFYHELAEAALDGWDRWNRDWPKALYHETGFLILSRGAMEPGGFEHESLRVLRERGYDPERIGGDALTRRYPAWCEGRYTDGYLSRRGGWAESGAVVARLLDLCVAADVTIRLDGFSSLVERSARVGGIRTTSGQSIEADCVVFCTGAWTPTLLPWLSNSMWATAQPVLHFGVQNPDEYRGTRFPPFAADIARTGWYGFPALRDGRLKLAHHGTGTRVHPNNPGVVEEEHVVRARAFLAEALPGLASAPLVGERVCMYCDTFDGDLWIDHDPEREGLVVAAGGSGHAFKFAPLLGRLIADVVESRPNRQVERFRWRRPGAGRTEAARFVPSPQETPIPRS
jgi:glycine/D-amino acid oxidase-like deaminating enzyme